MKVSGQKMEVTLPIYGRERTFSEQELIGILEKYFSTEVTEQQLIDMLEKNFSDEPTEKVAQIPTEDHWFEVNPLDIDQKLFQEKREDQRQEETRKLILEAFEELRNNPQKYGKSFKTIMPKKTWDHISFQELKLKASNLDGHMADWVEQALEWAQRIFNGESWKTICNDSDTGKWYRIVIWKNGYARLVGGSQESRNYRAPSGFETYGYDVDRLLNASVPLVVLYDK